MKTLLERKSEDQKNIEELKTIVESMLIEFFDCVLGNFPITQKEEILNKISQIIKQYKIIIDDESLIPNSAVCDMRNRQITYYEQFFNLTRLEKIVAMIHEYTHAVSKELAGISRYDMLEEGFADFMAELCVNNSIFNDTIDIETKRDNHYLKHGYIEPVQYGYSNCRELVKTIFATLALKNKDFEGIVTFCLLDKNAFDELCIKTIGDKYPLFLRTIQYVSINSEVDTSLSVVKESRETLLNACSGVLSETDVKQLMLANVKRNQSFNSIYNYDNNLIKEFIISKWVDEIMPSATDITFANFSKLVNSCGYVLRRIESDNRKIEQIFERLYNLDPKEFMNVVPRQMVHKFPITEKKEERKGGIR